MTEDGEAAKQNNYRFVVLHGAFRRGRVIIILRTRARGKRREKKGERKGEIVGTPRKVESVTINCAIVFSPMNRNQFSAARGLRLRAALSLSLAPL